MKNKKGSTIDYFGSLLENVSEEDIKNNETEAALIVQPKNDALLEISDKDINYKDLENMFKSLETDNETETFLKDEYKKYVNFGANSSLWLGKYYQDLFDGLSSRDKGANQYNSTYTTYITDVLKISVRTAKRYRDRYELYQITNDKKLKTLISLLSHDDVKLLHSNKNTLLKYLDKGMTKEEMQNYLNNLNINNAEQKKLEEHKDFNVDITGVTDRILNIQTKVNDVDPETFLVIEKYLTKIEKLLNKKEN